MTRLNLLRSLGCSRSAYRLGLLLDLAIDPGSGIDESHRLTAIQAVVGNTAGVDITLDFVRNRVSTISRRFVCDLLRWGFLVVIYELVDLFL